MSEESCSGAEPSKSHRPQRAQASAAEPSASRRVSDSSSDGVTFSIRPWSLRRDSASSSINCGTHSGRGNKVRLRFVLWSSANRCRPSRIPQMRATPVREATITRYEWGARHPVPNLRGVFAIRSYKLSPIAGERITAQPVNIRDRLCQGSAVLRAPKAEGPIRLPGIRGNAFAAGLK